MWSQGLDRETPLLLEHKLKTLEEINKLRWEVIQVGRCDLIIHSMTLWKALEKIPHLKSDEKFKLPCFNPLVIGFYYGVNNSTLDYEFTLGAWSIMVPTKTQVWTSNNHLWRWSWVVKTQMRYIKNHPQDIITIV